MYYVVHKWDSELGETAVAGVIEIQPAQDDAETATIVSVEPEDLIGSLNIESIQGGRFGAAVSNDNIQFDETLMSHWHALPAARPMNGYGGVEEYTDEEFKALLKEGGMEDGGWLPLLSEDQLRFTPDVGMFQIFLVIKTRK